MKDILVNAYAADPKNVGDLASSPIQYFDFNLPVKTLDIRALDPSFPVPRSGFGGSTTLEELRETAGQYRYHLIVGGGGLLFEKFLKSFMALRKTREIFSGSWILWGTGQQIYPTSYKPGNNLIDFLERSSRNFDYSSYVENFNLIGVRDFELGHRWVPCPSCMHPIFDEEHKIENKYVVFSHKKYKINIPFVPYMQNDSDEFERIIRFLGSGETILTSSYHGAYWASLLGRKVVAFPFSTKFATLKYCPTFYPVTNWQRSRLKIRPFKTSFLNKISFEFGNQTTFRCQVKGWKQIAENMQNAEPILTDCRTANQMFYSKVIDTIKM